MKLKCSPLSRLKQFLLGKKDNPKIHCSVYTEKKAKVSDELYAVFSRLCIDAASLSFEYGSSYFGFVQVGDEDVCPFIIVRVMNREEADAYAKSLVEALIEKAKNKTPPDETA